MNLEEQYIGVTIDAVENSLRGMQIAPMVTEQGGEARTVNLCKRCYTERLVQQGKQLLKSKEWRERLWKERLIVAVYGQFSEVNNF